nr:unknown [Zea mays]
MAGWTR